MAIELNQQWIRDIIRNSYVNRDITVNLAKKLIVHAGGEIPGYLIDERRPSEPEEIKKYRKKIYVPITENPVSKVISSLQKIRRSQDWGAQYDTGKTPSSIANGETLEDYCEFNYPVYSSVTNWVFSELLQRYLLDPNSFVAVVPERMPQSESTYVQPVAMVFRSDQIVDYVENEYLVLLSDDKVKYTTPKGRNTYYDGNIYYIITTTHVIRYKQTDRSGELEMDMEYIHNFGSLPAFKAGGIHYKRVNNDTIYKSRINSMIPSLDEAAREYSDLQAEVVQHIHSEKYVYTNQECTHCKGTGKTKEGDKHVKCNQCNGTGTISSVSPFGVYTIAPSKVGEQGIPTPPIGYIKKDIDIAKLQDERVNAHIYRALASINMEFLAEAPLNQSGLAKEVDKEELNNFVNSVAEDLVRIMDKVYYLINEYRYSVIVPSKEIRIEMLPSIPVPEKFDILNSSYLMDEIKKAKESGVSPILIKDMEKEYARKKYNYDTSIADELEAVTDIDPLYGHSQDEKVTMLNNGGITEEDYIVSCNIGQFVHRALAENGDFFNLNLSKKKELVYSYADLIIKKNSAKQTIKNDLNSMFNQSVEGMSRE